MIVPSRATRWVTPLGAGSFTPRRKYRRLHTHTHIKSHTRRRVFGTSLFPHTHNTLASLSRGIPASNYIPPVDDAFTPVPQRREIRMCVCVYDVHTRLLLSVDFLMDPSCVSCDLIWTVCQQPTYGCNCSGGTGQGARIGPARTA